MTGSNQRVRNRFRWMEAVLASRELKAAEKVVALRIALHLNDATGRCDPGEETLAKGIGMTPRYVRHLTGSLRRKLWLDAPVRPGARPGGRGVSNNYVLLFTNVSAPQTRNDISGFAERDTEQTRKVGAENPERRRLEPGSTIPPNNNNKKNLEDIRPRNNNELIVPGMAAAVSECPQSRSGRRRRLREAAESALAAKIGWSVLVELREDEISDLCERWSTGAVSDEELWTLKMQIERKLQAMPRRVAGGGANPFRCCR
jgi:hypothetical protein